jgi:L-seryl-tRNA(Ser) seleniumtransferase
MNYRNIPSVDSILSHPTVRDLLRVYARGVVLQLVRNSIDQTRQAVGIGDMSSNPDQIANAIAMEASLLWGPRPRSVINATGVILHTNLGRAPLSSDTMEAMARASQGYTALELQLSDGSRGSRQTIVDPLLRQLTGAEAALVVNNNAGAVLLALATIATGKEVIVSRGEAVEIGGGFRVPDVLLQSGASLVDVGTTNRTYISDYAAALNHSTGALLKIHSSNFRITGFTHETNIQDLVELGRSAAIPVIHDLGSGCLLETTQFGLAHEPMPQESVSAGVDLALFSGDKLLGGPQAGIIVGKKSLVDRMSKHPLARALRIDKVSLAALSATLLHYVRGEALSKVPVWQMVSLPLIDIEARANTWAERLGVGTSVTEGLSMMGGGSLPEETLPTCLLVLSTENMSGRAKDLTQRLREGVHPVIGRVEYDRVLLDPRTVLLHEEDNLLDAVRLAMRHLS